MSPTAQARGVELAYGEQGEGTPLLLVHGMADCGAAWAQTQELARQARVIVYDRRGYGASGAPEPYHATTVSEQAEDAAALLEALGAASAVVGGRDLGALVCLDLVKRHRPLARAAVVVDPPLYAFAPAATEVLSGERLGLEEALRDGGPQRAVQWWLEARGGAPPERLERAGRDHRAFFADFSALATWPVSRRELRAWDSPLIVLVSAGAPGHVRDAAVALAELVPGASLRPEDELVPVLRELL